MATGTYESYLLGCTKATSPSSFLMKPSKGTLFENLYVSQHASTGIDRCEAIIATSAVPAREYRAPLAYRECAPSRTKLALAITVPSADM